MAANTYLAMEEKKGEMSPVGVRSQERSFSSYSNRSREGSDYHVDAAVQLRNDALISQEEADALYSDMIHDAQSFMEIPEDVWGSMMFCIVKDFPDLLHCRIAQENALRTSIVTMCYFLNMLLQGALLFWILKMVTMPAVREAQNLYREFRVKTFKVDGTYNPAAFEALPEADKAEMCQIALSSAFFVSAILFLWVAQCLSELRRIWRFTVHLARLPALPTGFRQVEMVAEVTKGTGHFKEEKLLFLCINRTTKVIVYCLVFIPQTLIAIILCTSGCIWLSSSLSFSDLILNSLALAFVVEVDELIFSSFLPPRLRNNLQIMNIAVPEDQSIDEAEREKREIFAAYRRSFVFIGLIVLTVFLAVRYQPVLPGYRWDVGQACETYNAAHLLPWCPPWRNDCFPKAKAVPREL